MATDSNPTAAFWQAIHNFVEHLAAQVHARWDVGHTDMRSAISMR